MKQKSTKQKAAAAAQTRAATNGPASSLPASAVKPGASEPTVAPDHGASHNDVIRHPLPAVTIAAALDGERLDKALAQIMAENRPELSRTRLRLLIEGGQVRLQATDDQSGGTITDPSYRVKRGQSFAIVVPEPTAATPAAQPIPLIIVFEDDQVLVIDKPAGLVVHPAAGNPDQTLVNALLAHCGDSLSGIGGVRRPGIVHRIDKNTSGLMVVAKTDVAHASLAAQFEAHSLDRAYMAVVWGNPEPASGEIEGAIGRDPRHRQRMTVVSRNGKAALTRYKTIKRLGRLPGTATPVASLVECRLQTGRTHQIRVHMSWFGHPLLGDATYNTVKRGRRQPSRPPAAVAAAATLGRQALHAYRIGFQHPTRHEQLSFESKLPQDIKDLIAKLEMV